MSVEHEAKMAVGDHRPVRAALERAEAERVAAMLEENVFYDTADRRLLAAGSGMRLRVHRMLADGGTNVRMTFKGPKQPGLLKLRREIEFGVDDGDAAGELLAALGYEPIIRFEKRRERWRLGGCVVELDEMPRLGCFVEIEGPDEPTIMSIRQRLGLEDAELIADSYAAMLDAHLKEQGIESRVIRF